MGSLSERASSSGTRRLETALLLRAYAAGLFPMADTREADDVFWVEPRRRGILPLADFHLSRSLARTLRKDSFLHTADLAFGAVIQHCAAASEGREQSWINPMIADAYCRLHAEGHAHSIETWSLQGQLLGGLYGVRLGAAFFGESMFSRATDASKAALAHLVARLRAGGFMLLDTQFLTPHLARFGGREVKRHHYLALLGDAIGQPADWQALDARSALSCRQPGSEPVFDLPLGADPGPFFSPAALGAGGPSGKRIVQLLSQTS